MPVKIRLMRVGKTKQPTYRVVVADSRAARDGRIIESIGVYGPRHDPSRVEIDAERALGWLRRGAQPTEQVQKLLGVVGVWTRYEQERGGRVRTKLDRRGVTIGASSERAPAGGVSPPAASERDKDEPSSERAPAGGVSPPAASERDKEEEPGE